MIERTASDPRLARLAIALARRPIVRVPSPPGFRLAAVIALVVGDTVPALLFTERPNDLPLHAGQIAFPGGKCEPSDGSVEETALRELEEEIGVPGSLVTAIGGLDELLTPTGFHVAPVVGRAPRPLPLAPNPREVAAVFEVPLDELADPTCYASGGTREFLGVSYEMHEYSAGDRRIWGATARIVHQLVELWRPLAAVF